MMQGDDLKTLRRGLGWTQADMAEELGLTQQFIGMMERDEKPIERRTELAALHVAALRHARLFARDDDARPDDVPLTEAVICWEPTDATPGMPAVRVDRYGSAARPTPYENSDGADNGQWHAGDDVSRLLQLAVTFQLMVVRDGVNPRHALRALTKIPEFRASMPLDVDDGATRAPN